MKNMKISPEDAFCIELESNIIHGHGTALGTPHVTERMDSG